MSVVVFTLFSLVALYYFIKILRNFYKISNILKKYTENTTDELGNIGEHIRQSKLFTFFFGKEKVKKEPEKNSKKSI